MVQTGNAMQAHVTGMATDERGELHVIDANINGEYVFAFSSTQLDGCIDASCISFGSTGKYVLCAIFDKLIEMYGAELAAEAWTAASYAAAKKIIGGQADGRDD